PPRGLIGLLGLFGIRRPSVETRESRVDGDIPPQHAVETATRERALEAGEPPARVDAAPGQGASRPQPAGYRGEADELRLGRLAAAAGAGPGGRVVTRQERGPPRTAASQRPPQGTFRPARPRLRGLPRTGPHWTRPARPCSA